jgi:hypothetical protein
VWGRGRGETPFESESFGDDEEDGDEEEGEIIFPCNPTPEILPSSGDLLGRQMGAFASAHRVRCPRVDAVGASSLPSQSDLMLVCSILLGMHTCIVGAWITYSPGALQVPLSSLIAGSNVFVAMGSSSSDGGGCRASIQEGSSFVLPPGIYPVRVWG